MAKLRHIAIASDDPESLAGTLQQLFDFDEVGRIDNHLARGVYLTDGTVNIAVLRFHTDQLGRGLDFQGLHHVGYRVDDCGVALASMIAAGATAIDAAPRPGSRHTTVAFIHPKGSFGTLIELVQESPGGAH